jgi:hypothetical protein
MSRDTEIKLRTAEGYNQAVELERYEGCGSDASRGARGGHGANNMALQ